MSISTNSTNVYLIGTDCQRTMTMLRSIMQTTPKPDNSQYGNCKILPLKNYSTDGPFTHFGA